MPSRYPASKSRKQITKPRPTSSPSIPKGQTGTFASARAAQAAAVSRTAASKAAERALMRGFIRFIPYVGLGWLMLDLMRMSVWDAPRQGNEGYYDMTGWTEILNCPGRVWNMTLPYAAGVCTGFQPHTDAYVAANSGKIAKSRGTTLDTYTWNRFDNYSHSWGGDPNYELTRRQSTWRMQVPTTAPAPLEDYTVDDFWVDPVPGRPAAPVPPPLPNATPLVTIMPQLHPIGAPSVDPAPVPYSSVPSLRYNPGVPWQAQRQVGYAPPLRDGSPSAPGGQEGVKPNEYPVLGRLDTFNAPRTGNPAPSTPVKPHVRRPPGRYENEKKSRVRATVAVYLMARNTLSEVNDAVSAVYAALPKSLQSKSQWSMQQKLVHLTKHWDEVDPVAAYENLVKNQIIDMLVGRVHKRKSEFIDQWFKTRGFERAPLGAQALVNRLLEAF